METEQWNVNKVMIIIQSLILIEKTQGYFKDHKIFIDSYIL